MDNEQAQIEAEVVWARAFWQRCLDDAQKADARESRSNEFIAGAMLAFAKVYLKHRTEMFAPRGVS